MFVSVEIQPYEKWPREKTPPSRKRSSFRAGLQDTRAVLNTELSKLGARSYVMQINVRREDIRNNGDLRATARPEYAGVIVSFESKHGAQMFTCDAFNDWQSNLRGIALTLERLRLAELYGCAESGEQYKGFAQLPMNDFAATDAPFKTTDEAMVWVAEKGVVSEKLLREVPGVWRHTFQQLCKKMHPDAGGLTEDFQKLQYANSLVQEILPK